MVSTDKLVSGLHIYISKGSTGIQVSDLLIYIYMVSSGIPVSGLGFYGYTGLLFNIKHSRRLR